MIYGKDTAVEYPVADLYDTGMMAMYINAIKDQYDRGIKEQEQFISKYGDFVSPFAKDVDTWNRLTMDPVEKTYDDLVAHGIDPLRSQEGRAALSQVMRRVPRSTLSQLRQSAAAGQEYLKNRASLQAKGLYNPEFESFLLNGQSFNDWDTTLSGMWDRTSPTEYRGLRTLTDPWFKNRPAGGNYDAAMTKAKHDGYDYYTYTDKDMRKVVDDQIQAFLGNDYGRFYYSRALDNARRTAAPGESEESIQQRARDILTNDIVNANADYQIIRPVANPYAMEDYKYRHSVALQNMKHRQAMAQQAAAQQQPTYPARWNSTIAASSSIKRGQSDYNRVGEAIQYYVDKWTNKLNNSAKGSKEYNNAAKQLNWFKRAQTNYQNGSAWKIQDQYGVRTTDAGMKLLQKYNRERYKSVPFNTFENDYMNNYVVPLNGSNGSTALNSITTSEAKIPGADSDVKRRVVQFGIGNTQLARTRMGQSTGVGITPGSSSAKLDRYLRSHKVNGYVVSDQVGAARSVKRNGTGGYTDMYFSVYIPLNDLKDYMKSLGYDLNNTKDVNNFAKSVNGVVETVGYNGSGANRKGVQALKISAANSVEDTEMSSWDDARVDKSVWGTSNAYNLATNRQAEALMYSTH